MDVQTARELLRLHDGPLTAELLRKQYLRLALKTHPDKNPGDPLAAQRFAQLTDAHTALLEAGAGAAAALREQERAATLLDLLLRALQGEDVATKLAELGEYRPPAVFGVDLTARFDGRVPPAERGSYEAPVDLNQVFQEVFQQEGLTQEGDPQAGWELPLERDEY